MPWQVETWISQQLVRFASTDYGDSVVAAEDLLKAMEETYNPALKKNKGVRGHGCANGGGGSVGRRCLSAVLAVPRGPQMLAFKSEQPEVIARVQVVTGKLDELEASAETFKANVEVRVPMRRCWRWRRLVCVGVCGCSWPAATVFCCCILQRSKLKHMQLFACHKVAVWIEKQLGVFTSGIYGTTVDDTQNIIDDFEEYKLVLDVQKSVRVLSVPGTSHWRPVAMDGCR